MVCTINPDAGAVSESMSTLMFARRIKGVQVRGWGVFWIFWIFWGWGGFFCDGLDKLNHLMLF